MPSVAATVTSTDGGGGGGGAGGAPPAPAPAPDRRSIQFNDVVATERRVHRSKPHVRLEDQKTPTAVRPRLSENYEKPVSSRDGWWRSGIRETPVPGRYEHQDFLEDLEKKPVTYSFKSNGRKLEAQPYIGKGQLLLPGAYEHEDLVGQLDKARYTYGFRDSERNARDVLNFGRKDKDIDVPPNVYNTDQYLTLTVEKAPSKHSMFKSQSQRFPTIQFRPKDGPSPGEYDGKAPSTTKVVSSSFLSRTPRFSTSHTKVPGPGTYAATYKPMTTTITKMGRHYGLFFSTQFNTTV